MNVKNIVNLALQEDLGKLKDITSRAIFTDKSISKAVVRVKEDGIIAGLKVLEEVFNTISTDVNIELLVKDGDNVLSGTEACVIEGPTIDILEGERTALNFLCHLSGIATTVSHYVKAIEGTGVKLLDTRKTLPGMRLLEKQAVAFGGGVNHRMGLYDMVLIKDNHIIAAGGITHAVEKVRQAYGNQFLIEVEASTINDVKECLKCHIDRILLDNMTLDQLRESVQLVNKAIPLEASGNVNLETIKPIAETGVEYISVGSITHSTKVLDLSLLFVK